MREDVRRLLLFVVTLITGLLMIGVDLPLVQLLPVLVLIGVLLLFVTGALTAEDLGQFGGRLRRGTKEKSTKPEKKPAEKAPLTKEKGGPGLFARMRTSLQDLVPERVPQKQGEKKEKKGGIFSRGEKKSVPAKGKQAEDTSAPATPVQQATSSAPAPSGGGEKEEDPFLSLSEDELQMDLLDELDEMDSPVSEPAEDLSLDMDAVTYPTELELQGVDSILSEHASDLEEFTDLEGVDQIDSELASLDEVDMDEIQLSGLDGLEETDLSIPEIPSSSPAEIPDPTSAASAPALPAGPEAPFFALPQDSLPNEPEKKEPDMASFAAGSGGDSDMLSLLASDVKSVKVEADMSILRDLRDVKVNSQDLVSDLEGLLQFIGMPEVKGEKKGPGTLKR